MAEFDVERFILEVEVRPALWDFESPEYANKHLKMKAWEEVCEVFYPNFQGMETSEKGEKCKTLQKRWRSLRDCFAREITSQQKVKSGSAKSERKQYIFFQQLLFLRQGIEKRKTTSSLDETTSQMNDTMPGDLVQCSVVTDIQGESSAVQEVDSLQLPNASKPVETISVRPPSVTSRKRANEQIAATEMKLLQDISKRFAQKPATEILTKALEEDEDRLFLLSLLKDVKKVHEENKLELKSEMILLLKKWQRAGAPQSYLQSFPFNNQYDYRTNVQGNSFNFRGPETSAGGQNNAQNHSRGSAQHLLQKPCGVSADCSPSIIDPRSESQSPAYSDVTNMALSEY